MSDLISRAMLLEYIHNEPVGKMLCDKYNLDGVIKQFPAAQPEIIRCRDCAKYKTVNCAMDVWMSDIRIYTAKPDDFCSRAERREE